MGLTQSTAVPVYNGCSENPCRMSCCRSQDDDLKGAQLETGNVKISSTRLRSAGLTRTTCSLSNIRSTDWVTRRVNALDGTHNSCCMR